jgi:hypothetical protein
MALITQPRIQNETKPSELAGCKLIFVYSNSLKK